MILSRSSAIAVRITAGANDKMVAHGAIVEANCRTLKTISAAVHPAAPRVILFFDNGGQVEVAALPLATVAKDGQIPS
jgi:hypothetical protein